VAEWTVPKTENAAKACVQRHTAFMSIRYNHWFCNTTHGQDLDGIGYFTGADRRSYD